ncbi:MAG: hypothetical protein A2X40_06550 [Elusimicrobia bacterium GWC2_65_9]|nr:MAG: hypothetical protein A2X40_06550 [Elusimicrobia bacterium GWC2_65_9]
MTAERRGGPEGGLRTVGLSTPARHALRALPFLAAAPGMALDAGRAARGCGLPAAALAKTFQRLAARGLLRSWRGPRGGYRLARLPRKISLAEIVSALNPSGALPARCLLDDRPCRGGAPCMLHRSVAAAEARLLRALSRLTLADLVRGKASCGRAGHKAQR